MEENKIDPKEERTLTFTALEGDTLIRILHKATSVCGFDEIKFITQMYDRVMEAFKPSPIIKPKIGLVLD